MGELLNQWYYPEVSLNDAFLNADYDALLDYVDENIEVIFSACEEKKDDSLDDLIRVGVSIQRKFELSTVKDKLDLSAIYNMGILTGIIKAWSKIRTEEKQIATTAIEMEGASLRIKHLNEIIEVLNEGNYLSHKELSKQLKMKESALSECMKKVLETQLVMCRRSGKYKVYSLTDYGYQYLKSLEKRSNEILGKEELIEQIECGLKTMSSEDGEWLINRLEDIVSEKAYIFHKGDNIRIRSRGNDFSPIYRFDGRLEIRSKQERIYAILADPIDRKLNVKEVQDEQVMCGDVEGSFSGYEYNPGVSKNLLREVG